LDLMSARRITIEDVRARRQEILRILRARGAANPRVFGSVARGTADAKSDVDLIVDLTEPRPRGFAYIGLIDDLQEELARLLGRPVHVTELIDPSAAFAAEVERDAVAL
jgi:predicted nucleotidyltransferase